MASSQPSNGIIAGINVTPLVDVTLVLLVIFIVTAKIIVAPAVPMDLPRAQTSEELQTIFSVSVPANGPMLVNGTPLGDDEQLMQRARLAHAQHAELRVVIQADGGVSHRRVIHVLDLIKRAGIARIAFAALRPQDGTE